MGLTIPKCDWYEKAAVAIVRDGKTLFAYANEANLGLTSRECENVARTKEFAEVLRTERNKFYRELATDPSRSRYTAVGQLIFAIGRMLEAEQFDKAVAAIAQLAKLEGWTSDQAQVSVFNDLTGKDIDALRAKVTQAREREQRAKLPN